MDVRVVRDVVAVVLEGRGVHRLEPEAVDAERGNVIQPGRETGEIADAIPVAVGERLHMELIKHSVLVPEGIGGRPAGPWGAGRGRGRLGGFRRVSRAP